MGRTTRTISLLALALAAAVLVACGSKSGADVKDTVHKAFSTPIKSANIDLEVSLTLNGVKSLNGPVKLSVTGPYESGEGQTIPKADWDIAASAAGQNFTAGFTSTGTNAWVSFQGQAYEIGQANVAKVNQQIKQATGSGKKKGLSQFGVNPQDWITNPSDEGTATVDGVQTDHVSADLDVSKFLDDVNTLVAKAGGASGTKPPQLTEAQKKKVEDVVKNPRFDVYVGKDDDILRRLSADINFTVPSAQQAQLGGLTDGTLSFSIDFKDVGQPQTITPPTSAKPLSDLTSQLGGVAGALGGTGIGGSGSSSSSSSGSGSSGAPSSAALQKYSKCLQKANPSKPAELQRCAKLLTSK